MLESEVVDVLYKRDNPELLFSQKLSAVESHPWCKAKRKTPPRRWDGDFSVHRWYNSELQCTPLIKQVCVSII